MRPVHHLLMASIHQTALTTGQWGEVIGFCVRIAGFHALVLKLSMDRGGLAPSRLEI